MRIPISIVMTAVAVCMSTSAWARTPALLELKTKDKTYRGKLVAHNQNFCWLMAQDGRLNYLDLANVAEHRTVVPRFRCFSTAEIRNRVLREFGGDYEVVGTGHFLVCAARAQAGKYAPIFEDVYRSFHFYFSRRGFRMSQPEFPLIAIVFPNHKRFAKYCKQDQIRASAGLMGYYLPSTNRVALFDPGNAALSENSQDPATVAASPQFAKLFGPEDSRRPFPLLPVANLQPQANLPWHGRIKGSLRDTIIHETTHQVAFNTGLHSRIGANPDWVVEGLALVFEAPGIHDSTGSRAVKKRINPERYIWFGNFAKTRRKQKSLAAFVGRDTMFQTATLDAYSQAWALSFYLMETRPSKYSGYLKKIAQRDPLKAYPSKQRIADFTDAFGKDLDWLEVEFLRFMKRLP